MIDGQDVTSTCNYSTPYPVPESTEYYLYDGIDLTINTHFDLATAVNLISVQITRVAPHTSVALFQGFRGAGTPGCLNAWQNRCSQHTFDRDSNCDSCDFSVTLSDYDPSIDETAYASNVAANTGSVPCDVVSSRHNLRKYNCVSTTIKIRAILRKIWLGGSAATKKKKNRVLVFVRFCKLSYIKLHFM